MDVKISFMFIVAENTRSVNIVVCNDVVGLSVCSSEVNMFVNLCVKFVLGGASQYR